jgi:hypothetical protein
VTSSGNSGSSAITKDHRNIAEILLRVIAHESNPYTTMYCKGNKCSFIFWQFYREKRIGKNNLNVYN